VTGNHRFCDDSRPSDTCDSIRASQQQYISGHPAGSTTHTLPHCQLILFFQKRTDAPPEHQAATTYGCFVFCRHTGPRRGHFDTLGPRHSTPTPDFPDFSVNRPFRYVTQQGSSPLVGLAPHRSLLMQLDRRCACQCGSLTCSCFGFEFWCFGVQMFPAT